MQTKHKLYIWIQPDGIKRFTSILNSHNFGHALIKHAKNRRSIQPTIEQTWFYFESSEEAQPKHNLRLGTFSRGESSSPSPKYGNETRLPVQEYISTLWLFRHLFISKGFKLGGSKTLRDRGTGLGDLDINIFETDNPRAISSWKAKIEPLDFLIHCEMHPAVDCRMRHCIVSCAFHRTETLLPRWTALDEAPPHYSLEKRSFSTSIICPFAARNHESRAADFRT